MTGASADSPLPNPKIALFGFQFDSCTLAQAADRILDLVDTGEVGHYVVTPNVDHAVLLHERPELAQIYDDASLVVADGQPLIWASRLFGKSLPERVAGSDLVPAIFNSARRQLSVYLFGARSGVAESAATYVQQRYPNVRIVGVQSPPIGFEKDPEMNAAAAALIAAAGPDILVLGLGAPKQELWAYRERHHLASKVILCAGATIDFLAGERVRAPLWCQRYGLEWAYRALEEPKRMVPRYAKDATTLPLLLAKECLRIGQGARGRRS